MKWPGQWSVFSMELLDQAALRSRVTQDKTAGHDKPGNPENVLLRERISQAEAQEVQSP